MNCSHHNVINVTCSDGSNCLLGKIGPLPTKVLCHVGVNSALNTYLMEGPQVDMNQTKKSVL